MDFHFQKCPTSPKVTFFYFSQPSKPLFRYTLTSFKTFCSPFSRFAIKFFQGLAKGVSYILALHEVNKITDMRRSGVTFLLLKLCICCQSFPMKVGEEKVLWPVEKEESSPGPDYFYDKEGFEDETTPLPPSAALMQKVNHLFSCLKQQQVKS